MFERHLTWIRIILFYELPCTAGYKVLSFLGKLGYTNKNKRRQSIYKSCVSDNNINILLSNVLDLSEHKYSVIILYFMFVTYFKIP